MIGPRWFLVFPARYRIMLVNIPGLRRLLLVLRLQLDRQLLRKLQTAVPQAGRTARTSRKVRLVVQVEPDVGHRRLREPRHRRDLRLHQRRRRVSVSGGGAVGLLGKRKVSFPVPEVVQPQAR